MKESSKSLRRRWCEHELGVFPWRNLFKGFGLDVGSGDDPLPFDNCTHFDKADGDANFLSEYFAGHNGLMNGRPFDFIHASNVLEHLIDPVACLKDWLKLLRPGGHLIATVPDLGLYERFQFPSRFNPDHKSTWSMIYRRGPAPVHVYLPDALSEIADETGARIVLSRLVDTNFDYMASHSTDQTFEETEQVECWNEFVISKK